MEASVERLITGDPTLANRYLADQLSEEERAAFEERMVTDPTLLREVELTARFKVGLAHLQETGELATVLQQRRSLAPWAGAIAASLVVAVALIGLLRWDRGSDALMMAASASAFQADGGVLAGGPTFRLLRVRAAEQDIVIGMPSTRASIRLLILPDSGDAQSRYQVSLQQLDSEGAAAGGRSIVKGLQPDPEGFVQVFVDSGRLMEGNYRLEVSLENPVERETSAGSFLVRIQPGAGRP